MKIKEPRKERVQNNVKAMPDTGAMMCLVGMNTMYNMGLRESDLVEVDMQVNAANNKKHESYTICTYEPHSLFQHVK